MAESSTWISRRPVARRVMLAAAIDAAAWVLAIPLWFLLRYEGFSGFDSPGAWVRIAIAIAIAVAVSVGVAVVLVVRQGRPLAGTFEDMLRLVTCNMVGGLALLAADLLASPRLIPISVVVGATATATLLSMGWRGAIRVRRQQDRLGAGTTKRAIVFGAGDGGIQLIDSILRDQASAYRPVAMLDDDPAKNHLSVRGVRVVGGRESIRSVAEKFHASVLVIAIPSASSVLVREVAALGVDAGLEIRVLPAISELLEGHVGVGDVRSVSEVDLLGRTIIETDMQAAAELITGKRVLVTGAGGSIGSEITRQVHRLGPVSLTMLDRDESALHALQLELEGRALLDSRHLVVADIRDRERILRVFEEHRPEIVFHAAALKHLPLLEMQATEAVKSNVFGTKNVLDCAGAVGVSHFVNVSTDKAANPTSALGVSKRLAEGLTSSAAQRFDGTFLSVRFGNVLGSRGTVIDSFRAQIAAGGPMTVTDPEVTRYFMTVSEAVQLVLQAATFGGDGEVMVLDMGEPVRIAALAAQLAAASPEPIEIVYTGLRPGEKLHEDLFGAGEVGARAVHPLIFHVSTPALDDAALEALRSVDDESATSAMLAVVAAQMVVGVPGEEPGP